MRKFVALFAAGAVCALGLTAFSGAATKKTVWTAALSSGQEVPKQVVKMAAAPARSRELTGTTLTGSRPCEPDRAGDRRAHPLGSQGEGRERPYSALRRNACLQERPDRHRDHHQGRNVGVQEASPLCERPHREESERRDPRTTRQRLIGKSGSRRHRRRRSAREGGAPGCRAAPLGVGGQVAPSSLIPCKDGLDLAFRRVRQF